jgi:predicted metalloprotease
MKWENLGRSSNVEDIRLSNSSRGSGAKGSLRLLFYLIRFLLQTKFGRIVLAIGLVAGIIAHLMGYDPLSLLNGTQTQAKTTKTITPSQKKSAEFVSVVLGQTEKVWHHLFAQNGMKYEEPKLVLFRQGVTSGCGYASSQTGPFYCPSDKKVYLDLAFFDELKRRHNAPGDFAQAYVIAHEVGHHVQNILGDLSRSKRTNEEQVKIELQADCYSGVWAHYLDGILEDGDIEEALNAASAIGDDTLQKNARGYVTPDTFTHGSSAKRVGWFKNGYEGGKLNSCQTGI